MRSRDKLLIAGTLIFGVIVITGIYISQESQKFKNYHESFVRSFVKDMSKSWELDDFTDRLSDEFKEQAQSEEGLAQLEKFSVLGSVIEINNLIMGKYFSGSEGTFGEFIMNGRFDREDVLIKITVHEQSGEARVRGVTINRLDESGRQIEF